MRANSPAVELLGFARFCVPVSFCSMNSLELSLTDPLELSSRLRKNNVFFITSCVSNLFCILRFGRCLGGTSSRTRPVVNTQRIKKREFLPVCRSQQEETIESPDALCISNCDTSAGRPDRRINPPCVDKHKKITNQPFLTFFIFFDFLPLFDFFSSFLGVKASFFPFSMVQVDVFLGFSLADNGWLVGF